MSLEPAEYCREIESYLCRKNEGHLIRIVGPAFELVCGWAARGVPFKIACRGIDQYCERYYAKGPRRRPVRIEFCEADILDLFDAWRRAVGVSSPATPDPAEPAEEAAPRKPALAAHIERVVARLTTLRDGGRISDVFVERIDAAVRELDQMGSLARTARGEARARLIERLGHLDKALLAASVEALDPARAGDLQRDAEEELAPFRARMPAEAFQQARGAAFHRLVREALRVPIVAYD